MTLWSAGMVQQGWHGGLPTPVDTHVLARHKEQEGSRVGRDEWEGDPVEGIVLQGCQEMKNFLLSLLRLEHDPVRHICMATSSDPLQQWLRNSHSLFLSCRRNVPSEILPLSLVPRSLLSVLIYSFNKR